MIRFESDYCEGAHPALIKSLADTNLEQTQGYGTDEYCRNASQKIKNLCSNEDIDVHFLVGGTQCNLTLIGAALKSYQAVLSASSGHINQHETGAIEATGHKVVSIESTDGKIKAFQVEQICSQHYSDTQREHTVQPGMVYISNPTECGTIYNKAELSDLSQVCKKYGLIFYMDGARLGYGLTCEGNDLTLADISRLCDAFYIGGTKCGSLFGEALVITRNTQLRNDFRYHIKQRGAMLAKGRILGVQFDTLFTEGLYFDICRHANDLAVKLRNAFSEKGYSFLFDSPTNQIFPIIDNDTLSRLGKKYSYSFWQKINEDTSAVRFCTSWATRTEDIEELINDLK